MHHSSTPQDPAPNYALKYQDICLQDYLILDIREPKDYQQAHIKNAVHSNHLSEVLNIALEYANKKILIYCYHGVMARFFCHTLRSQGLDNVYFLEENIEDFPTLGIPLESSKTP